MSKYNFDTWLNSQKCLDLSEIMANGFDVISDAELIANGFRKEEQGFSKEECEIFSIRVKSARMANVCVFVWIRTHYVNPYTKRKIFNGPSF